MQAAAGTVERSAERARRAVERATTPAASTTPATRPAAAPARSRAAEPGLAATGLTRDSTVRQAAEALAGDLLQVPGIERFGYVRLADLDTSGPRPLRTIWRVARDRLQRDYGNLTIGEIIDRYRGGDGGSAGLSAGG